ncbi:MAG: PhoH family protein [Candidatus Acetothermia bacterium]|nr:PhoH family protein [Candidatus Acetothermia bacterium]MDH7505160.1 PhoH family protein [Candidatus Acetothermia bacterium]
MSQELILKDQEEATALFGGLNRNLNYIKEQFPKVKIIARGNKIHLEGSADEVALVHGLLDKLLDIIADNHVPSLEEVRYLAEKTKEGEDLRGVLSDVIQVTHWGEEIRPKTVGQRRYIEAIEQNDVVFGIGPAGTGKTYLAVAEAVAHLKRGKVGRIILTRPAVEAGEELGFLPGDIQAKVNPYLRPLYDALYDMVSSDEIARYRGDGRIEIAPLAFMRGRTLNNSFVILDEAQNTTHTQLKMFLTRLGFHSKVVVTGDITQIDLERGRSGLVEVQHILKGIEGISFIYLDKGDVVRHHLVRRIIEAYERAEGGKGEES